MAIFKVTDKFIENELQVLLQISRKRCLPYRLSELRHISVMWPTSSLYEFTDTHAYFLDSDTSLEKHPIQHTHTCINFASSNWLLLTIQKVGVQPRTSTSLPRYSLPYHKGLCNGSSILQYAPLELLEHSHPSSITTSPSRSLTTSLRHPCAPSL